MKKSVAVCRFTGEAGSERPANDRHKLMSAGRHVKGIGFLPVCLALILCACTEKDTPVEHYGVSFICPAGWKVSETEDNESYQSITVEKKGIGSSGIAIITLFDGELELDEFLQIFKDALEEQEEYSNMEFQDTEDAYGQYEGPSCKYTVLTMSQPHRGSMHVFNANGRSVHIMQQEAVEDSKANLPGFRKLEESFTVD
ncbi:MAG: hypothetical protein LBJ23_10955 [Tannerella sp.]|jgi:hypothetical protein|nr:hypothetical protein [Tannerella sp.]